MVREVPKINYGLRPEHSARRLEFSSKYKLESRMLGSFVTVTESEVKVRDNIE